MLDTMTTMHELEYKIVIIMRLMDDERNKEIHFCQWTILIDRRVFGERSRNQVSVSGPGVVSMSF